MLITIAVVVSVLWIPGLLTSQTFGGFIHVLPAVAFIAMLARGMQGHPVLSE